MKWIKDFYKYCTELAQKPYALPILGAFSFCESIFIPIPTDPIHIAICASRPRAALKVAAITILSSVLGASVGYFLGFYFSGSMQSFLLEHLLTIEQWSFIKDSFMKGTFLFVFIGGFTPLPFKVFAISAGLLGGSFFPFLAGAFVGRGLRFGIVSVLFYFYGESIRLWIDKNFEKVVWIVTGLIVFVVGIYYFAF